MLHKKIPSWDDFESTVRSELSLLRHTGFVTARNFHLVSFTPDGEEVNRLNVALSTGTDRDKHSPFWNAKGFDYEHDLYPFGKSPDEIIYAFTIDVSMSPYRVYRDTAPEVLDITKGLSEHDGIIIYDSTKLDRKTVNEYWFKTSPLDAAIMIITIS